MARGRIFRKPSRVELTARELEISHLLTTEALQVKEAAARLGLSIHTIEAHRHNAYGKLGVHNRMELARALTQMEAGLVAQKQTA